MRNYDKMCQLWLRIWRTKDYGSRIDSPEYRRQSEVLIKTLASALSDVESFCELGLGNGRNVHYFHKLFPDWEYRANDINPETNSVIAKHYPDVLDYCSIVILDTLSYLKECKPADLIFTHGHLMHIPDDAILEVCELMEQKANKYIALFEALEHLSYAEVKNYRFERDYLDIFNLKPIKIIPIIHKESGYLQMLYLLGKS
jgi:hypothetical protein